jgi:hypothetical protein
MFCRDIVDSFDMRQRKSSSRHAPASPRHSRDDLMSLLSLIKQKRLLHPLNIEPGLQQFNRQHETWIYGTDQRATFGTTTIAPLNGSENERFVRECQRQLCRHPLFQQEIMHLKSTVDDADTKEDVAGAIAKTISDRWGFDGAEWVLWLAQHWDPSKQEMPPLEPGPSRPIFAHWLVEVSRVSHTSEASIEVPYVRITLRAGVSKEQARQALKEAMDRLPASTLRGRPALSERDTKLLWREFERQRIPANPTEGERLAVCRRIHKALREVYGKDGMTSSPGSIGTISLSTIKKQLYEYLRHNRFTINRRGKHPPVTKTSDVRTSAPTSKL